MKSRWTRGVLVVLAVMATVSLVVAAGWFASRGEPRQAARPLPEAVVEGTSAVLGEVVAADPAQSGVPVSVTSGYGTRTSSGASPAIGAASASPTSGRPGTGSPQATAPGDSASVGPESGDGGGGAGDDGAGTGSGEDGGRPPARDGFDLVILWWNDSGEQAPAGTTISVGGSSWRPTAAGERQQGTLEDLELGTAQLTIRLGGAGAQTIAVPIEIGSEMLSGSERDAVHVELRADRVRVLGNPVENFDRIFQRD